MLNRTISMKRALSFRDRMMNIVYWTNLGRPVWGDLWVNWWLRPLLISFLFWGTKKRQNEENCLNYAYFDAQLRENALYTQLKRIRLTFHFVYVLFSLSFHDLRFFHKLRASSKMKKLPERGCPEKHENMSKITAYSWCITEVNHIQLRIKSIQLLWDSIKKFRLLNLTGKSFVELQILTVRIWAF